MIKVGLTGNIGSGKSTVARMFEILRVPVFYADIVAKDLYLDDKVKKEVARNMPIDVFVNNEIDKKLLAQVIFGDLKYLKVINEIIHPRVFAAYKLWCKTNEAFDYTIHEAAIIFENSIQNRFDYTIIVTAPEDIRVERVLARDNTDLESVKKRIQNQMNEHEKVKLADFVIENNGDSFLTPQVLEIHELLIKKAHSSE